MTIQNFLNFKSLHSHHSSSYVFLMQNFSLVSSFISLQYQSIYENELFQKIFSQTFLTEKICGNDQWYLNSNRLDWVKVVYLFYSESNQQH